ARSPQGMEGKMEVEKDVVRKVGEADNPEPYAIGEHKVDINPALPLNQRLELIEVLERNKDRFTMNMAELEVTTVLEHEVNVRPGSKPVYQPRSRRLAPKELDYLQKNVAEELATGKIIEFES
ncbi:hypothetical protein BGZ95_009079, partial [Linnemannia exigua]